LVSTAADAYLVVDNYLKVFKKRLTDKDLYRSVRS